MDGSLGRREMAALGLCLAAQNDGYSVGEMAVRLGVSSAVASRVVASLLKQGLFSVTRVGKRKFVTISSAPHALALKELAAANPHVAIEEMLANSAVRVLAGMTVGPASVDGIASAILASQVTVRRILIKLLDCGVVAREKPALYAIVLPRLLDFAREYACFALESRRGGVQGSLICAGPHGLLRTAGMPGKGWVPTGISVLQRHGVKLIETDARDYYCNAFGDEPRSPGFEDVVVHALVRATLLVSGREASYAMLAVHKNRRKLDEARFLRIAAEFGASGAAGRCLDLVDRFIKGEEWPEPMLAGVPREGPLWPSWMEFNELVKAYE